MNMFDIDIRSMTIQPDPVTYSARLREWVDDGCYRAVAACRDGPGLCIHVHELPSRILISLSRRMFC